MSVAPSAGIIVQVKGDLEEVYKNPSVGSTI